MEYPLLWNLNKLQFFPSYHAIEKFFTAHFLNENVELTVRALTLRVIARTRLIFPAGAFAFKITRVFNQRSCTISNGKIT